ncbi:MAG: hypothetical protein FJ276_18245 [Planctomycetes bacterium]|nr:hypothetical protein [Planctomycetota bacterium]
MPTVILAAAFMLATVATAGPASATDTIVPGPEDAASGARHALETWQLGGIGGTWLAVGQPNTTNRDDRAVFRFDIRRYLTAGKVAKVTLRLSADPQTRGETFRLEHFTAERIVLAAKDLRSTQVELVRSFEVKRGTPAGLTLRFDVTGAVNRDLEAGFGFSTFRLRSEFAEAVGNPDNTPSLISIVSGSLALDVTP